MIKAGIVI